MKTYHKIQSIYKRDPETKFKTFIDGDWSVDAFGLLKDLVWEFTEKVDGTNIRVGWDGENVAYGGRTDSADIPSVLMNNMREIFTVANMQKLKGPVTLIGEGYGGKIQKGSRYREDQNFILFDVFIEPTEDHPLGVYLPRSTVDEIADMLSIPSVPVIHKGPLLDGVDMCKGNLTSSVADDKTLVSEGVVCRPEVELFDRLGRRVITKIKVRDFL